MTLLLDNTAKRYGVLPSQLIREGDTLDIHIVNTATAWEQYQSDLAQARQSGKPMPAPMIPEEKLQQMVQKVKEKKQ